MARRTRWLLNIIDRLPTNSSYAEAVAQDDEAARFHLAAGLEPAAPTMRLADWSPEVAELRVIADRLATVANAIVGKDMKFPSLPRPRVAMDRIKYEVAVEKHLYLVARLLPDGEG